MLISGMSDPVILVIVFALFVVSITLHELGHALTADLLGDPTPREHGRVTVNPLAHLDFFGTLFVLLAGFGWAKPVPVMTHKLRWPRFGNFLVSAAGPFVNFLLALAALLTMDHWTTMPPGSQTWFAIAFTLNVALMVLNLLPIPPLDGGHILESLLPRRWLPTFDQLVPYGAVLLLVLILLPGPFQPLSWLNKQAAALMIRIFT